MKQINRQLLNAFGLAVISAIALSPTANAVEFRVTTVQVRSGEVVEIENITQNFRARQSEQINNQSADTVSSALRSRQAASGQQGQVETVTVGNQADSPNVLAVM